MTPEDFDERLTRLEKAIEKIREALRLYGILK